MSNAEIKLKKFFAKVDRCASCRAAKNPLRHVFGGGQAQTPKYFFLFINPTHKNISTHPAYKGTRRYPFMGVRHFYKELSQAGFVDKKIIADIYKRGWQLEDENRIERNLCKEGVYITNFVKCARPDPSNPSLSAIRAHLPLLAEELEIVRPQFIVTFGLLPLSALAGGTFCMRDFLAAARGNMYKPVLSQAINQKTYPILPCFYPLGHGNPPKAQEILAYIKKHFP